jgi:Dcp1-like decapping family
MNGVPLYMARYSYEIMDIVTTAAHAAMLYEFFTKDTTVPRWTKCNIDGSLFLVEGRVPPQRP